MRWLLLTVILAATLCVAAPQCPDPHLREVEIGGNVIIGGVGLNKKPLRFAHVRVVFSSGKTVWTGKTNSDGWFKTSRLRPGDYRLEVDGWGSTIVRVNPELDKGHHGQIPAWNVLLMDDGCVGTTTIMN